MRHWLSQIVLLAGILAFLNRLPELGSTGAALLAASLAVATVWAICAVVDDLRASGLPSPSQLLAAESES
jgi:hypothetical protein